MPKTATQLLDTSERYLTEVQETLARECKKYNREELGDLTKRYFALDRRLAALREAVKNQNKTKGFNRYRRNEEVIHLEKCSKLHEEVMTASKLAEKRHLDETIFSEVLSRGLATEFGSSTSDLNTTRSKPIYQPEGLSSRLKVS